MATRGEIPPTATALWVTGPRRAELRATALRAPGEGEALVRTLATGVSRGTELLVYRHEVPDEIASRMRAPFQEGDLPGPVKYGYLAVGMVEEGPDDWVGRRVFCLHPHQDRFVVPVTALTAVPDDIPTPRAVLAGTVETAVNALWDARPLLGDDVAVVGAGMVGASVALLLRRFPLGRLQVIEPDKGRAESLRRAGLDVVPPEEAEGDCDLAFHASASEQGLATALAVLGEEGEVVELSWYGTRAPSVPLGGAFHARRLSIRASQVSRVSPSRSVRRGYADRMAVAMDALRDPAFDLLLAGEVPFADLPHALSEIDAGHRTGLCHVVVYPRGAPCSA